jgi:hypothetical protein
VDATTVEVKEAVLGVPTPSGAVMVAVFVNVLLTAPVGSAWTVTTTSVAPGLTVPTFTVAVLLAVLTVPLVLVALSKVTPVGNGSENVIVAGPAVLAGVVGFEIVNVYCTNPFWAT